MARIFRHPEVEDYFHELDVAAISAGELAGSATGLYEAGQVCLLKGARIEFDRDFIASLAFDEPATRKFQSINFLKHYARGGLFDPVPEGQGELLRDGFGGDKRRFRHFAEQVRSVNEQVDALVARLFPTYRIDKPSITWRINETINENLHIDVYNEDIPTHHLRLFVNLDNVPRIWHTSHTLDYMLRHHLDLLDEAFVRTASPGRICHDLNFALFKGFKEAGREGQPKHIVFFDPGEIWVVDSRKVSHQIFFGRKALSTEHAIARESMADPSTHYYDVVEKYRRLRAA